MIYEIKCSDVNKFASLVRSPGQMISVHDYLPDGRSLAHATLPKVEKYFDKKRKTQKERADIGYFTIGVLVLNQRAHRILSDYFLQFGELLPLDCKDGFAWLYNVTNLISCIDWAASKKEFDEVVIAKFDESRVPSSPQIFKDKLTSIRKIYLNQAAKDDLEEILRANNLTGWKIEEAGVADGY